MPGLPRRPHVPHGPAPRARGRRAGAVVVALAALALGAAGCGKERTLHLLPNQPPEVRLTQAPASTSEPYFYAYEIFWTGFDPDGRVDHFLYAVDPPTEANAETTWVKTTENRRKFLFASGDPDSLGTPTNPGGFHVFLIKCVDDRGAQSPLISRAFFTYTVGPTVTFVQPKAHPLLYPLVPPTTAVTWTGDDPDGVTTRKPVAYKYLLLSEDNLEFPILEALLRPDSLRRRYAPEFEGWPTVSGDTVTVRFTNLIPDNAYLLVVVAIDEAGAYSPIFTLAKNMLYFYCQYTGFAGPRFTVYNDFFNYTYASGGYNPDPAAYVHIEAPAGQRIPFHWYAVPNAGTQMRRYRWALDIEDLSDETPRSNELTDVRHWSQWGLGTTSAVVGPFDDDGTHLLAIEGEDDNGLRSLAMIETRVVRPTFAKPLLFVDDTRFPADQKIAGRDSIRAPGPGNWPSAAEIDTFFFARGGVRWRYYPPGTLSSPGMFQGYEFDTIGTRFVRDAYVPLSTLANYRHVVWYVDPALNYVKPPYDAALPQPGLRWMSGSGQTNTLATFSRMGGGVWLLGGGAAYNSLHAWNSTANDGGGAIVYSKSAGELVPGRMLYDRAGWRSELTSGKAAWATRALGAAPGREGSPDFSGLPAELMFKSPATDPIPPLRAYSTFYVSLYDGEFLTQSNTVTEDLDPDPEVERIESVLDTLYVGQGSLHAENRPIMTIYHGSGGGPFVYSGFPLWYFQRAQAIDLADFVLQRVFGLTREPVPR